MEMVKKVSVSPVQATASDEGALPFPFGHTHAHIVVAVVAYSRLCLVPSSMQARRFSTNIGSCISLVSLISYLDLS